jgi:hypothetical protein
MKIYQEILESAQRTGMIAHRQFLIIKVRNSVGRERQTYQECIEMVDSVLFQLFSLAYQNADKTKHNEDLLSFVIEINKT